MMGVVSFLNFRTFLTIFVAGFTINFASAGLLVFFWIQILHLPYPIPLVGFTSKTLLFSIVIVVFWFQFPISWRRNSQFKQKAKYLLLAHIFIYIMDTERFFLFVVVSRCTTGFPMDISTYVSLIERNKCNDFDKDLQKHWG